VKGGRLISGVTFAPFCSTCALTEILNKPASLKQIKPISLSVVLHPRSLELEGGTGGFISGIFLVDEGAVVVFFDARDAVKPRTRGAKIKFEYLRDLSLRVCVKQLIGD
jgi:hypothetical protein